MTDEPTYNPVATMAISGTLLVEMLRLPPGTEIWGLGGYGSPVEVRVSHHDIKPDAERVDARFVYRTRRETDFVAWQLADKDGKTLS